MRLLLLAFALLGCGHHDARLAGYLIQHGGPSLPSGAVAVSPDADLLERVQEATWLVAYDHIAWTTSDFLLADPTLDKSQLGRAWFVLPNGDDGVIATYGRLVDGHYVAARTVRVAMDRTQSFTTPPPADVADPRARALDTVWKQDLPKSLTDLQQYGVNPNQYVDVADDGSIVVWLLPSLAPNGDLVVATCARYTLDPTGATIRDVKVEEREALGTSMGDSVTAIFDSVDPERPTACELYWALDYADDVGLVAVRAGGNLYAFTRGDHVLMMFQDAK